MRLLPQPGIGLHLLDEFNPGLHGRLLTGGIGMEGENLNLTASAGLIPRRDLCETPAAAKSLGLDFIPLTPERYDLVVPEHLWGPPL
jgi:hypothetical protein